MSIKKFFVVYKCAISGGTDRLLIHIIKNWPDRNVNWILFLHKDNSGNSLIAEELSELSIKINIYSSRKNYISKYKNKSILPRTLFKIIFILYELVNVFVSINYFRKQLILESPSVLYLHNGGYPGAIDAHAASIAGWSLNIKRIVMGIQNIPILVGKNIISLIFNKINNQCIDAFIFGNERSEDIYKEETDLDKTKFFSIHEGVYVNLNNICNENTDDIIKIGMIASFEKRKGHHILFKALSVLNSDSELNDFNYKVICYGQQEFGEYTQVRKYAMALGVEHRVEYYKFEKDMNNLYLPLDIIVLPSIDFETMPLVLIDAQAYYKPIIGSELQGIIDIIDHGENGYLFPVGDYKALAQYIKELVLDPGKRREFGIKGRKKYELCFTAKTMCNSYEKVFNN